MNKYSRTLTQAEDQPGSQAMLHATGLTRDDFKKAQVGIASTGWDGNPCNMHLNGLAGEVKDAVWAQEMVGLKFHTIGVSDGITMGTDGMRFSLLSRDLIADSIETVVRAQYYDSLIAIVGCDKNMPGAMMAIARINRPAIVMYGGTIKPGYHDGKKLDIVSAFEALGHKVAGDIDVEEYHEIIKKAIPGPGACGGMYTANTMSSAIEAMGMSLPFNSSIPAVGSEKKNEPKQLASAIKNLMQQNILPSDILSKKAFENAITTLVCLGGSTNAVLHLLAMAHAAKVDLTMNDFQEISHRTPFLADLKPSGQFVMEDLYNVGGVPGVMKFLNNEGMLHADCMTVTGKTLGENLATVPDLKENQKVIFPLSNPIKKTGHLQILFGNLAKEGAVAKITGKEGEKFTGPAIVFDGEKAANDAIIDKKISKGSVIVIRYCGPKGGPGMPEMLKPTSLIMGAGLGNDVALITDGRFSGGTHGFVVGHITPEAYDGGAIGLLQDDDIITIDAIARTLDVHITDEEINNRRKKWVNPTPEETFGVLRKYRKSVSTASRGCITDD